MKKLISGLLLFYLVFWVVTGVYAAWRLNLFTGELDYYVDGIPAGGIVYTAPPDDGDAGEQLQTNGAGVLTWEAAGAGGSGDAVTVNSTAIDTTANIKDSSDITWAITDGGAGGPDDIAGTVVDDSHNHVVGNIDSNTSANWAGQISDETGTGIFVFNNSPTFSDTIQLGENGADGQLILWAEQATDRLATLNPNSAMASNADFYLPADEPAATSIMTMTTGGVITNQSTSAGLYGALSDETGSASGSPLAVFNQAPTISSPVITNINPGGDFTLTNNSVAAFTSVNAGALVNTLYLKDGKVGIGTTAPGGKLEVASGNVFFGDTANTFSTQGLTINQAGNDDEILALKSSDISHSATSATEADTFFTLKKSHANLGGLRATSYYGNMSTGSHIINDIWIGQLTMTGANTGMVGTRFLEPDITAASALAVTTASTLYIRNAPTASGSASITNSYALWVDEGNVRFDGNVGIGTTGPTQALELGASKSMAFEGTTDDTVETIIGVIDPTTSDKTINFPNASGTVAVSATAPATLSALGDIGVNILGDLVCTSPVTGSANDIFPGANGTKATIALDFTAAWDFGGATSLEVPNDAAPVVDAIGEIALDTTDDQLVYFGASKRVLRYEEEKSCVIEDLAAADDNKSLGMFSEAVTITGIAVSYIGTGTTPATITLEDGSGNAMTITGGSPTAVAHGTNATFAAVTAGNTLVVGEILRFDVTNAVAPETDDYTIAIKYTVDAQ